MTSELTNGPTISLTFVLDLTRAGSSTYSSYRDRPNQCFKDPLQSVVALNEAESSHTVDTPTLITNNQ